MPSYSKQFPICIGPECATIRETLATTSRSTFFLNNTKNEQYNRNNFAQTHFDWRKYFQPNILHRIQFLFYIFGVFCLYFFRDHSRGTDLPLFRPNSFGVSSPPIKLLVVSLFSFSLLLGVPNTIWYFSFLSQKLASGISLLFQVIFFFVSYPPSNEENSCHQVNDDDEHKKTIATWMPARCTKPSLLLFRATTMKIPQNIFETKNNITMRNSTKEILSFSANELGSASLRDAFPFQKNNSTAYPGRKSVTKRSFYSALVVRNSREFWLSTSTRWKWIWRRKNKWGTPNRSPQRHRLGVATGGGWW